MPNDLAAGHDEVNSPRVNDGSGLCEYFSIQHRDGNICGFELINNQGFQQRLPCWALAGGGNDDANFGDNGCAVGTVVFSLDGSALAWTLSPSQVLILPWRPLDGRVDDWCEATCPVIINTFTGSDTGLMSGPNVCAMTAVTSLCVIRVSGCPGIWGRVSGVAGTADVDMSVNAKRARGECLLWTSLLGKLLAADLLLVTGHVNGVIRIWDGYTGRLLVKLLDNKSKILSLKFAPNGSLRLASAHADHTIKLWDLLDDGNMYKTLRGHTGAVCCVDWSPNGRRLASVGAGRQIRVWDMENGIGDPPCLRISGGHQNNIVKCQFTQDGALLATASLDTQVILWDSRTGSKVGCLYHVLPAPHMIYASGLNSCWIRDLALFPDGCHGATVSDDKKLRVWDLSRGDKPVAEKVLPAPATCCTVSPKGNTIVVGFKNGEVKFFHPHTLEVPSLCHLARLALRKTVVRFPSQIDCLPLPRTLKPYLLYQDLYSLA